MKGQASEMEYFYHLFSKSQTTASAAGWVFEFRMHQLLRDGCTIQLFPIGSHHVDNNTIYNCYSSLYDGQDTKALMLPTSEEHSLLPNMTLTMGNYYRPLNSDINFPEINSLFLIKPPNERSPILLMFQMTQDKDRHDVKPKDLLAVEGLDLPLNTRKWLVVVTPFNIEPKIVVPKTDFPDRWVDTNIDEVFHFPFPLPCSDANDVLAHTAAGAHTRNTTKGFPSILHRTLHVSNCTVYCREWVKNDTCTTGVT